MHKTLKIILYVVFAVYELFLLLATVGALDSSSRIITIILMVVPLIILGLIYMQKNYPDKIEKFNENIKRWSGEADKEKIQQRIVENKEQGIACCPKCGSTSLSGNKKGFGIGKAVVGASLTGGIGLVAGNLNAKKVRVTCLNCGHQFFPKK